MWTNKGFVYLKDNFFVFVREVADNEPTFQLLQLFNELATFLGLFLNTQMYKKIFHVEECIYIYSNASICENAVFVEIFPTYNRTRDASY